MAWSAKESTRGNVSLLTSVCLVVFSWSDTLMPAGGSSSFFLGRDRVRSPWRWLAWALCALIGVTFSIEASPVATAAGAVKPAFGEAKKQAKVSSRPDEMSAAVSARAQGSPVEVESLRSETSQTFANPDGTMTTKATSAPTRFKDDQGAWKNIDLTLEEQADGSVTPKSVKNEITLGAGDALESAPASIPPTSEATFNPALAPLSPGTLRCSSASRRSPADSARARRGTSPPDTTRFGSSNATDVRDRVWESCIYEMPFVAVDLGPSTSPIFLPRKGILMLRHAHPTNPPVDPG